jgi:DNA-binding beta-propeller fold protein YncE
MKMANFSMPRSTAGAQVNDEAHVDTTVAMLGAVAVRRGPIGDIAAVNGAIVVTNYGDDTVSLLSADAFAVNGVIAVPGEPVGVVVTDDRAYVSTSSWNHDAVSVIDTAARAVIATYPLAFSVTALAVSPDGKRVFAGRTGDDYVDVAVIDITAERVGTIDIATGAGMGLDAVKVDATDKRLYVATTDARGSALVVVDLETTAVERTVQVGAPIRDIAFADGTAYVLTSDRLCGGVVNVIDAATGEITGTVELGIGSPTQLTMSADDARAYIVDYDHVAVLCLQTLEVINTISVSARPSCVAVDCEGGRVHVADFAGGVTVFAVGSAAPPQYSQFVATDPIRVPGLRELEPASA